jgi:hypothetical protein
MVWVLGTSPANASPGLVFANSKPLSFSWKELKSGRRVAVCNGSRKQARKLIAVASGFGFKHNREHRLNSKVLQVKPSKSKLRPGRCGALTVKAFRRQKVDPGTYTGAIAVTAAGVGVARLGLTVTRPEAVTKAPVVSGALEEATLRLVNDLPRANGGSREVGDLLLRPPPPDGASLSLGEGCMPPEGGEGWNSVTCPLVGNLYQGTEIVHVFIAGALVHGEGVEKLPLRIESSDHLVGDYAGVLDPSGSGEKDQMVKTKLTAKDSVCSAVIALLLGALIALVAQLLSTRFRPEYLIKRRAKAIVDKYKGAKRWDPKNRKIEVDLGSARSYSAGVLEAIEAYVGSVLIIDSTSEAYKQIEASISLAEEDVKALTADGDNLATSLDLLEAEVEKAREMLVDEYRIDETPALVARAAAPLMPGELGVGDATERAKVARELAPLLRRWRYMARRVLRYEVWLIALDKKTHGNNEKAKEIGPDLTAIAIVLAELREELFRASKGVDLDRIASSYRIESAFAKLSVLGGKEKVGEPDEPLRALENVKPGEALEDVSDRLSKRTSPETKVEDVEWDEWKLKASSAIPAEIPEKRRFLLAIDTLVLAISLITAVVAGLAAFYFGKTFGTFEDYLTVIFAGTAAQAVLKVILDNLSVFLHDISAATDLEPPTAKTAPKTS